MLRSMKAGSALIALTATAGVTFLAGCGTTSDGSDTASSGSGSCKKVELAFMGPLTGDSANLGLNAQGGMKTALAEYNKAHSDCTVGEKDFDSQGDPEKATPLATQIVNEPAIIGVVGPTFSGESNATGPAFSEAGIVTVSASATNPDLTKQGWKTFHRVLANDDEQAPAVAKYISGTLKATKVFVADDASDYGKGLASGVKKALGSAVIGSDRVQVKQTDFGPTVTKIKASGATAFFYGGYYAEAGLLAKQLRAGGWKGFFVSGDGSDDPGFVEAAGTKGSEDARLTCPCGAASAEYAAKYKAAVGKDPGTYSAEAYDATKTMLDGIGEGKNTRETLLPYVSAYDKPGLTKQIKFSPTGEVASNIIYSYKVTGGKIDIEGAIK